ncbi:TfoX/Sxy family protein [Brevibacterium linens]|uniref:TfoX/Sxy family protein n=1 Tax=Brevibacterium linens TaxID=1703 RepID=UPI003BF47CB4
MTPEQTSLIERIHALIADEPVVREVSMFGGRAVMVNEKMIVSAGKTGDLLVRVDAVRHDELLEAAGARQAEMGTGREMGPGWIEVSAEAIADGKALSSWVETAMDFNRAVTGTQN